LEIENKFIAQEEGNAKLKEGRMDRDHLFVQQSEGLG
jgi:hypothetical protein